MAQGLEDLSSYRRLCQHSPIGKRLPDALYVHRSALVHLDLDLQAIAAQAQTQVPQAAQATLVKFSFDPPQVSYLFYPTFDTEAHPPLQRSIQVKLPSLEVRDRDYHRSQNPPILHRKETFLHPDHPHYTAFATLTRQEEILGLLDDPRTIGFRQGWEQRLQTHRLTLEGHALACPLSTEAQTLPPQPKIQRHRAAIARVTASKPLRLAVEAGLLATATTYFDYGCGRGIDVEYAHRLGLSSAGWDPHFRPSVTPTPADVVNLSYVINVIEDPAERREALMVAWGLAQRVLIVAAQVLIDDRSRGMVPYGDGIITRHNTFQKYYEQEELKTYIDQVLEVDAIPVALGIYFVFRDDSEAETFRAARFRSRITAPQIRLQVSKFDQYRDRLQPLMDFYTERGRLPTAEELAPTQLGPLQEAFGSIRRAFTVILQATDEDEWAAIAGKRRDDLLVYLALSHFGHRPKFKDLAPVLQQDIKALLGSYHQACAAADAMLMGLGQPEVIEAQCRQSEIGQQRPNSLWVHVSALERLSPVLRLYEGCASRTLGRPEEATVIKFHAQKPQITYLTFPDFDRDPHPALKTSMAISLRNLQVRYRDYDPDNPPLLHQKEQTLAPDYPAYAKFAKLSQQEQKWGLLTDMKAIFDRQGWEHCLRNRGGKLRGHRIVRHSEPPTSQP